MNAAARKKMFTFLTVAGFALLVYFIYSKNVFQIVMWTLFTIVSADNITCGDK